MENSGDEALGHLRQAVGIARVAEGVGVALEEGEVGVHPRPLHSEQGLGHEGGVDAPLLSDLFDDQADGHDVVGHGHSVGVAKVDLVLGGPVLVLGVLDGDPHLLEGEHRALAQVPGQVGHRELEVGAVVQRDGRRSRRDVLRGEVEVLELGGGVEAEALFPSPFDGASQDIAGVALERGPVQVGDVADHPGGLVAAARFGIAHGQDLEGAGIGAGQNVGFLHPAEAIHGRSVEGEAFLKSVLQLGRGDAHRLLDPEDVGEPQLDEADPPLLDRPQDVLVLAFGTWLHLAILAAIGRPWSGRGGSSHSVHKP